VAQELMLSGSVDFVSLGAYESFLTAMLERLNVGRRQRLHEEMEVMRELPARRMESFKCERVKVGLGSLIYVDRNVYSAPSRLIGEHVEARLFMDHVEVWYGKKRVAEMPRLRWRQKHRVDYRHIIDWLVRKPGAFDHYRYRGKLFPTSRFRMTFDPLEEELGRHQGSKENLKMLEWQPRTARSESMRRCLSCWDQAMSRTALRGSRPCWARAEHGLPRCRGGGCGSQSLRSAVQRAGGAAMSAAPQVRTALTENLKALHLPAMRVLRAGRAAGGGHQS
jgi:hypothetical protein